MILTLSMGEDYAIKSSIEGLHPTVARARNADTELAARCDAEAAGVSCLDSAHSIRKTVDCCRCDQKES